MKKAINRRNALKRAFLAAGATGLLPHLSFGSEVPPVRELKNWRLDYSPFYREYLPSEMPEIIRARLNSNENKFGPSPQALKALAGQAEHGNLYGWQPIEMLKQEIADREGVTADHVLIGPGSTDFLEKCGMVFFKDGGNLVSADPTFMTLIRVAEASGADWKNIPLKKDWSHDLGAMESAIDNNTRMVYVCNPNNPTGTLTDFNDVISFARKVSSRTPVFVDEAYLEFLQPDTGRSAAELVREGSDVIVARTFSKIHGMAGLRIGYVIGQPATLEKIARMSFTGMGIANTSIAAARESLRDTAFVDDCRIKHDELRRLTEDGLRGLGYDPVRSYTSFMIFPIRTGGRQFLDEMSKRGVAVRAVQIGGQPYCRVSLGRREELEIFLENVQQADT